MVSSMATVYFIQMIFFTYGCAIYIYLTYLTEDLSNIDMFITMWLFIGTGIVESFMGIICVPQWFAHIEIDKEGISLNTVYKKTKKESYDKYPFFTIASYQQIYTTRYFVVIGKRGLSLYELAHINRVKNSQEIIKLVLNKKTYKFLMKILPHNKKAILEKSLSQGKVVNSNTYKNMLERKKRK